jgi:hypothetical protein
MITDEIAKPDGSGTDEFISGIAEHEVKAEEHKCWNT